MSKEFLERPDMVASIEVTQGRKGYCEGNKDKCNLPDCPKFGLLGRASRDGKRRVRGCNDPAARGKRNRTKGDTKARYARRKLGLAATGNAGSRHEEHWGGLFRVEVKAGAQVSPIATRFDNAKAQSDASKALGDIRPFAMIAMPEGNSDGIVLMTLNEFAELITLITQGFN